MPAGQTEAFGILVRRYQDRLYPTIVRLVGGPEDAQDVLQDAFVRAFEKLDQFHGESSFYTWIYRIAVNLAPLAIASGNNGGSTGPSRPGKGIPGEEPADESPETDPAFALERVEREAIVEAVLATLGPEQRAVWCSRTSTAAATRRSSPCLIFPSAPCGAGFIEPGANFENDCGHWSSEEGRPDGESSRISRDQLMHDLTFSNSRSS